MKSHDKITMSIAKAVEQVFENNADFVDLHSIDANKRRGSEPLTEKDIDEANEFTKAAAKAAVAGDKDFKFDGKSYPTEMDVDVAKKILGESVSVNEAIDFSKVNDDQLKGWLKVFKTHTGNPWSGFKDDVKRAEKEAKKRGLEESVDLEEGVISNVVKSVAAKFDDAAVKKLIGAVNDSTAIQVIIELDKLSPKKRANLHRAITSWIERNSNNAAVKQLTRLQTSLKESVDLEESLAIKKIDKITNMLDSLEIALRPKGNLNKLVNKELEGNYDNDFKIVFDYITAASAKWEDEVVFDLHNQQI